MSVKTEEKHGYTALQLGAGDAPERVCNKPMLGQYLAANVPPKRVLKECRVSKDAVLPVGTVIHAALERR